MSPFTIIKLFTAGITAVTALATLVEKLQKIAHNENAEQRRKENHATKKSLQEKRQNY